jgi:hypothetical protein
MPEHLRAADAEQFFSRHLQAVAARLEWNTKRALERQRAARREMLRREAMLTDRDFDLAEPPRDQR